MAKGVIISFRIPAVDIPKLDRRLEKWNHSRLYQSRGQYVKWRFLNGDLNRRR